MNAAPPATEIFEHTRVMMSVVIGLSVTRLLTGFAEFIQHPKRQKISLLHLGWALAMLLTCINFWWRELALMEISHWSFSIYLFLITATVLLFLLCALLFPSSVDEYGGYEAFFLARRRWFFAILAVAVLCDVADTAIKGHAYYSTFAGQYFVRVPFYLAVCGVAVSTPDRQIHRMIVIASLGYQIFWIASVFNLPS